MAHPGARLVESHQESDACRRIAPRSPTAAPPCPEVHPSELPPPQSRANRVGPRRGGCPSYRYPPRAWSDVGFGRSMPTCPWLLRSPRRPGSAPRARPELQTLPRRWGRSCSLHVQRHKLMAWPQPASRGRRDLVAACARHPSPRPLGRCARATGHRNTRALVCLPLPRDGRLAIPFWASLTLAPARGIRHERPLGWANRFPRPPRPVPGAAGRPVCPSRLSVFAVCARTTGRAADCRSARSSPGSGITQTSADPAYRRTHSMRRPAPANVLIAISA